MFCKSFGLVVFVLAFGFYCECYEVIRKKERRMAVSDELFIDPPDVSI